MNVRREEKKNVKMKRKKSSGITKQLIIPMDVIENILSWLPVKPLIRFKSVSPEWYTLINSKPFINLHSKRGDLLQNDERLRMFFSSSPYAKARCMTLDLSTVDNHGVGDNNDNVREISAERVRIPLPGSLRYKVVGSCNGIVCLRNYHGWEFMLVNPSTRTHLKLPSLKDDKRRISSAPRPNACMFMWYGFGYNRVDDDYIVVKIDQFGRRVEHDDNLVYDTKTVVYSWRNKNWGDMIEDKIDGLVPDDHYVPTRGVSFNNALHWLARQKTGQQPQLVITRFDLCTRRFDPESMPLPLPVDYNIYEDATRLLVDINGCLHFMVIEHLHSLKTYDNMLKSVADIWMIKDCSIKTREAWCRLGKIVVPFDFPSYNRPLSCSPVISYSKSHDQFLMSYAGYTTLDGTGDVTHGFYLKNLRSGERGACYKYTGTDRFYSMQPYVESLVSLHDVDEQKLMKAYKKRKQEEKLKKKLKRSREHEKCLQLEIDRLKMRRGEKEAEELREELNRSRDRENCLQTEIDRLQKCVKRMTKLRASRAAEVRAKCEEILQCCELDNA